MAFGFFKKRTESKVLSAERHCLKPFLETNNWGARGQHATHGDLGCRLTSEVTTESHPPTTSKLPLNYKMTAAIFTQLFWWFALDQSGDLLGISTG